MQRPIVAADPAPFSFTEAGLARLHSLPDGHGIHVGTRPSATGRTAVVEEGPLQGPPPEGYERMTIGDRDLHRLRGLVLEYDGEAWRLSTHLELRARETPNPDGRLYLCNRHLAEGRVFSFNAQSETPPVLAQLFLGVPGIHSVLFRENTVTVERVPDEPWERIDGFVNHALQTHFLSVGHRLTGEAVTQTGLLGEVQAILEQHVLPGIHRDGGDLHLLSVDDGIVRVELHGACRSCPASSATLKMGVERTLKQALGDRIVRVENVEPTEAA